MEEVLDKYHDKAVAVVKTERRFQIEKWGTEHEQFHRFPEETWNSYLRTKLVVLMEEVGELSKEALEHRKSHALSEAIQVAAVSLAIVEGLLSTNE